MVKPVAAGPDITGFHKDSSQTKLEKTCAEFESIFITYMLKSMRTTVVDDGLFGNDNESKIIKSMFDENLALELSRGGGIGLGKVLFDRLKEADNGSNV